MIYIVIGIIVLLILYLIFKPYFIQYTNTVCLTGEMGVGKTNVAVNKVTIPVFRRRYYTAKFRNFIRRQINKLIKKHNQNVVKRATKKTKHYGRTWNELGYYDLPRVLTNIPVCLKWSRKKEKQIWSNILEKEMLTFQYLEGELIKLPEGSIVFIDELPQWINQFNWDIPEVQDNVNEFVTFIRHYFDGMLVITAQAVGQVVKPLREKMNTFYYLNSIRKFLFKFYAIDVIQFMSTELVANFTEGFVEDNTKTIYGMFHKHRYDSRCFSPRYQDLPENKKYKFKQWHKFKTKRIIRFGKYKSPLDPKPKKVENQ